MKLGIILNLPRVGGTLFGRILVATNSVFLLSEVHPARRGQDIVAHHREELAGYTGRPGYVDLIRHLASRYHVLVRDHTHLDFTAPQGASYRFTCLEALREFDPGIVALTRHPVDQFLSCMSREGMRRNLTLEHFAKGWAEYHCRLIDLRTTAPELAVVRYEDLVSDAQGQMAKVFKALQIGPDFEALTRFHAVHSVSGDRDQPSRAYDEKSIVQLPAREGYQEVRDALAKAPALCVVAREFGYEL